MTEEIRAGIQSITNSKHSFCSIDVPEGEQGTVTLECWFFRVEQEITQLLDRFLFFRCRGRGIYRRKLRILEQTLTLFGILNAPLNAVDSNLAGFRNFWSSIKQKFLKTAKGIAVR